MSSLSKIYISLLFHLAIVVGIPCHYNRTSHPLAARVLSVLSSGPLNATQTPVRMWVNEPHLSKKIGLDVMQSHPQYKMQYLSWVEAGMEGASLNCWVCKIIRNTFETTN